jgi:putative Ca2+/H+ antiporter (TMEM165/GDT1 family)
VVGGIEGRGPGGQLEQRGEAGPQRVGPFRVVRYVLAIAGGRVRYSGPVDLAVVLTTFVVIFPAELPDKSLFASLVLGTRFRPLPVFCGVAAAFAVHVVIAVTIGGVFVALLPQRLVLFVVSALFAGGAALLLFGREDAAEEGAAEASRAVADRRPAHVVLASFGVVFLGEWGDITQITTANLAARYGDPISVGIGALLALWSVSALALTMGRGLARRVPTRLVRRLTGAVLALLAVVSLVEAIRT